MTPQEIELRQKAAEIQGVPADHVFIEYYSPKESKTDRWNVMLGLNNGPGTDTVQDTWAYGHPTYEAGVSAILLRTDPWVKAWQENVLEELHYVPDIELGLWWIHDDREVAWRACQSAVAMLWIAGQRKHTPRTGVLQTVRHFVSVGLRWIPNTDLTPPMRSTLMALSDAFGETSDAARYYIQDTALGLMARAPRADTEVDKSDLPLWHIQRLMIAASCVATGAYERAYEVPYHLKQILLSNTPGYKLFDRNMSDVVRRYVPSEVLR